MNADRDFADYCCELLQSAGPCTAKRMFGGWGISVDRLTFALIADLGDRIEFGRHAVGHGHWGDISAEALFYGLVTALVFYNQA